MDEIWPRRTRDYLGRRGLRFILHWPVQAKGPGRRIWGKALVDVLAYVFNLPVVGASSPDDDDE